MDGPLIGISTGFTDYGDYLGIAFSRPLERLGAVPVVLPYIEHPEPLVERLDGIVLAVGRDLAPEGHGAERHPSSTLHSPFRDAAELALVPAAIAAGVPLLGICRGAQVINAALGGSLHPDHSVLAPPADRHPGGDWARWERVVHARLSGASAPAHPSHEIAIAPGSRLADALGQRATVNSYHHQSIAELGDGVLPTAWAPDGVIEAIEVPAPALCMGVQWELQEEPESPVFEVFVDEVRGAVAARGPRSGGVRAPA